MKTQRAKISVLVIVSIIFLAFPSVTLTGWTAEKKTTKEEVKQEIKEAFEAVQDLTAEQRDEAVKKSRLLWKSWTVKLKVWKTVLEKNGTKWIRRPGGKRDQPWRRLENNATSLQNGTVA